MSKPGKKSAAVVAQLLSTEGFSEYTANQVKRYWMASVMDPRRYRRVKNIQKAFSKLVAEKLDEGDRLVLGKFISLLEKMGFDTGLRIGLTAFLHGANIGPELEEKYAKQEQDLDEFAEAIMKLHAALEPFAAMATWRDLNDPSLPVPDEYPLSWTALSEAELAQAKQDGGPMPTIGDIRRAAAILAEITVSNGAKKRGK